jgi:hypothetical protein
MDGMRATLLANESRSTLEIHDHRTGKTESIRVERGPEGHGGGDDGLMNAFVGALRGDRAGVLTSVREALESHLLAFAAERARTLGEVVEMDAFRRSVG